jgi:type IV pilus assembly protein PilA
MLKAIVKKFRYGEKGFTLIELLVVVAVLGALAAVAIPNVGRFIGQGEDEAAQTELHNIQTAVLALMADNGASAIDGTTFPISTTDLDTITVGSGAAALSTYMTGLNADGTVQSGTSYDFSQDGNVVPTP